MTPDGHLFYKSTSLSSTTFAFIARPRADDRQLGLMQLLRIVFLSITFITVILNAYIYLYPVFRGCGFPTKDGFLSKPAYPWIKAYEQLRQYNSTSSQTAEFRLLVFGDPQLEGDTSIWHPHKDALYRPEVLLQRLQQADSFDEKLGLLRDAARDAIIKALPQQLLSWRKQLDLVGNDYYLAHIYRTLHAYTKPTHVSVLGDLLGSQWIDDEEFSRRASRFWNRVFRHGIRVDDDITAQRREEPLGANPDWERRIINIAGNHDVGYAGDMTLERLSRFERAFGKANWELVLHHPQQDASTGKHPILRIVVLNSMNLDTPAKSQELQTETYAFLNDVIINSKPVEDRTVGTILLTHIPLHKESGTCVDGPFFDFHGPDKDHSLKEQNHISYAAGMGILQGVFGMSDDVNGPGLGLGRNGIILSGHDHEGCDVYHYLPRESKSDDGDGDEPTSPRWNATRYHRSLEQIGASIPGIREVTLRSMMGEFGGYAYMFSAWFDGEQGRWQFEINSCGAGIQHWWWAAHILLLVALGLGSLVAVDGWMRTQGVPAEAHTAASSPRQKRKGGMSSAKKGKL